MSIAEPMTRKTQTTESSALHVEVLDLAGELNSPVSTLRSDWLQLFEADRGASILLHPDYTSAELSARTFAGWPSLAVCCRQGGQLVGFGALVPKLSRWRNVGGVGPNWSIRGYHLVGNGFLASGSPEIEQRLLQSTLDEITRRGARYLLIEDLDLKSPLRDAVNQFRGQGFSQYSPTGVQERLKIQLPATASEYWGKFSSKTRNTFKRKEKKLGQIRLVKVTRLEQIPDFLRDANAISKNTWQTDQFGLRVRNDDQEMRLFSFLALQGALRSYLLYLDDKPAAFLIGNQYNGVFRYEEVGYDRVYGHLSPGQVLLVKVLDEMFSDRCPEWFDFGFGDADYKRIFANVESQAGNVWVVPGNWRGYGMVTALNMSRRMRKFGRQLIHKLGYYTRLRQLSRQAKSNASTTASDPGSKETKESSTND